MRIVDNPDVRKWYKYMHVVNVLNAHDVFCFAENGCDFDQSVSVEVKLCEPINLGCGESC